MFHYQDLFGNHRVTKRLKAAVTINAYHPVNDKVHLQNIVLLGKPCPHFKICRLNFAVFNTLKERVLYFKFKIMYPNRQSAKLDYVLTSSHHPSLPEKRIAN